MANFKYTLEITENNLKLVQNFEQGIPEIIAAHSNEISLGTLKVTRDSEYEVFISLTNTCLERGSATHPCTTWVCFIDELDDAVVETTITEDKIDKEVLRSTTDNYNSLFSPSSPSTRTLYIENDTLITLQFERKKLICVESLSELEQHNSVIEEELVENNPMPPQSQQISEELVENNPMPPQNQQISEELSEYNSSTENLSVYNSSSENSVYNSIADANLNQGDSSENGRDGYEYNHNEPSIRYF